MKPYDLPDATGHFGPYGGVFVAETLMHALAELREAYERYREDPGFIAEFNDELEHYVGRPTPIYHARRWSSEIENSLTDDFPSVPRPLHVYEPYTSTFRLVLHS